MTPAFSSWGAFFAMGGYAFWIWLSAMCTLAAFGGVILHTVIQRRRLLKAIRQQHLREQRMHMAQHKKMVKLQETHSESPS